MSFPGTSATGTRNGVPATQRAFSPAIKRLAWSRCNGQCEYVRAGERCAMALGPGNRIYDHIVPWWLTRDSSLENCQVICTGCDREKTPRDQTDIAKVRAVTDKHLGIKGPGRGRSPMPCGRLSGRSKTMAGAVVPRQSPSEKHRALMAKLGREVRS